MQCPKCGKQLEEDSKFCVYCGTNIEMEGETEQMEPVREHPQSEASMNQVNNNVDSHEKPKNVDMYFMPGLIVGTLLIVLGIYKACSAGTSISSTSFGGDFYTYTYQGIVAVSEILAQIESSIGWLIAAIGAAIDVYSLRHR